MKFFIFLFALVCSVPALAVGPFGDKVKLKEIGGRPDPTGCTADDVLSEEFSRNGIGIVDGTAPFSWTCDDVSSTEAEAKRCPFPQYKKDGESEVRCFSNTSKGGIFICVEGARSEKIRVPGSSPLKFEQRTRFQKLHISSYNAQDYRHDRSFEMDDNGCQVTDVRDESGHVVNFEKCADQYQRFLTGGFIYPGISTEKYCDPNPKNRLNQIHEYANSIEKLNFCIMNIPNFAERFEAWHPKNSNASPAVDATGAIKAD